MQPQAITPTYPSALTQEEINFLFGTNDPRELMLAMDMHNTSNGVDDKCNYEMVFTLSGSLKDVILYHADLPNDLHKVLEFFFTRNLSLSGCFLDLGAAA